MATVIKFPPTRDLELIKALAYGNYDTIRTAGSGICMHCSYRPLFEEITNWYTDDEGLRTAECPKCDSPVVIPEITIDLLNATLSQMGSSRYEIPPDVTQVDQFIYTELVEMIDRVERQFDVDVSLETILAMTRRLAVRKFPLNEIIKEVKETHKHQSAFKLKEHI